ncbi:MAG: DUF115 domain-containing protein [Bradymonadales bacterium]|nr:MAG: DUF115 domain-containing protein [Bradymonadales bacterium]
MKALEDNLGLLMQRYPDYQAQVSRFGDEKFFRKFSLSESEAGLELFEGEKLVDSTKDDFLDFRLPTETNTQILVVFGFGLGVSLLKLLELTKEDFQRVIVVEPSWERFIYALGLTNLESVLSHPKIEWCIGRSREACFASFFEVLHQKELAAVLSTSLIYKHPMIYPMYQDYFDAIEDELEASKKAIKRSFGNFEDSLLGLQFSLENRKWIEKTSGVRYLKDAFKGVPALVLSAGPSLAKSLPQVKKLQNKALIISVDASLKPVLEAGIQPHFVTSLERSHETKKFFESIGQGSSIKTDLIAYPLVPNEVIESYPGKTWVSYRDHAYFQFFEKTCPRGIVPSKTSVSHFSARLADWMGCSEIVLLGQDLSYDPKSLSSHVDGVAIPAWSQSKSLEELSLELQKSQGTAPFYVPGNEGGMLPTNPQWFSMMKEFSWEATQLAAPLLNASFGGAKIPGVPWVKLEEVAKEWQEREDLFGVRDDLHPPEVSGSLDLAEIIERLESFEVRLQQLHDQSQALVQDLKTLQPALQMKMMTLLRESLRSLMSDPVFVAFVAELKSAVHFELENEWNVLRARIESVPVFSKILSRWYAEMLDALQRVLPLLKESQK